jgi:hypothetical protein
MMALPPALEFPPGEEDVTVIPFPIDWGNLFP